MKTTAILAFACALIGISFYSNVQEKRDIKQSGSNSIFAKGDRITNDNFKGTAYLKMLMDADSINPTTVGNVTFERGSRTKWHVHPGGQILLALDGIGYYQEKGQEKKILRKGDVIKCPSNVSHWHGASEHVEFVQIAITNRHLGPTVWLQEVTEEEYKK